MIEISICIVYLPYMITKYPQNVHWWSLAPCVKPRWLLLLSFLGYYCRSGAYVATPEQITPVGVNLWRNMTNCTCPTCDCSPGIFNFSNAGPCPQGYYCPVGTDEPIPCPRGTFSNRSKLQSESQCYNCTPGSFCGEKNLTKPSGLCRAGYYCPIGSSRSDWISCPIGQYCVEGSKEPTNCPSGTYRNITNGKNKTSDCWPCPGGKYCGTPGLSKSTGDCAPGYVLIY